MIFGPRQLDRIENAIIGLRADLRLKEQQDRIEAQQLRIVEQLAEMLRILDERAELDADAKSLSTELRQTVGDIQSDVDSHKPKT